MEINSYYLLCAVDGASGIDFVSNVVCEDATYIEPGYFDYDINYECIQAVKINALYEDDPEYDGTVQVELNNGVVEKVDINSLDSFLSEHNLELLAEDWYESKEECINKFEKIAQDVAIDIVDERDWEQYQYRKHSLHKCPVSVRGIPISKFLSLY